jgi:hypothetical protein
VFIRLIIVVLDSPACFKEEITFESTVVSYFVTNFVNGTELISVEKSSPDLIILMDFILSISNETKLKLFSSLANSSSPFSTRFRVYSNVIFLPTFNRVKLLDAAILVIF